MAVEFRRFKVGEKARIEILKPTVCDLQDVNPGDIVEASPGTAWELISFGKAKYADEPAVVVEPVAEPETPKQKAK